MRNALFPPSFFLLSAAEERLDARGARSAREFAVLYKRDYLVPRKASVPPFRPSKHGIQYRYVSTYTSVSRGSRGGLGSRIQLDSYVEYRFCSRFRMSSASARFTEYSRTNERACRSDDRRRRRNTRYIYIYIHVCQRFSSSGQLVVSNQEKRKMKLPPWWVPDAPLSLCERCLTVDSFFISFFLFFAKLHRSFLSLLLHLIPSDVFLFSPRRIRDD